MDSPEDEPRSGRSPLAVLEDVYRRLRGRSRDLRLSDRLREDLDVDSLLGMELLVQVEDAVGVELLNDPRVARLRTVGELVGLIEAKQDARRA